MVGKLRPEEKGLASGTPLAIGTGPTTEASCLGVQSLLDSSEFKSYAARSAKQLRVAAMDLLGESVRLVGGNTRK
jgi:hypothetical protein